MLPFGLSPFACPLIQLIDIGMFPPIQSYESFMRESFVRRQLDIHKPSLSRTLSCPDTMGKKNQVSPEVFDQKRRHLHMFRTGTLMVVRIKPRVKFAPTRPTKARRV